MMFVHVNSAIGRELMQGQTPPATKRPLFPDPDLQFLRWHKE